MKETDSPEMPLPVELRTIPELDELHQLKAKLDKLSDILISFCEPREVQLAVREISDVAIEYDKEAAELAKYMDLSKQTSLKHNGLELLDMLCQDARNMHYESELTNKTPPTIDRSTPNAILRLAWNHLNQIQAEIFEITQLMDK